LKCEGVFESLRGLYVALDVDIKSAAIGESFGTPNPVVSLLSVSIPGY
jgi:hypothetical protein